MRYLKQTLEFMVEEETVVTLGKFDGLHRGHELLMNELMNISKKNQLSTVVFTFDIPPKTKVDDVTVKVLTTNDEKQHIFERSGVDYLIECPFTKDVMCMSPEDFIGWICNKLHMKYVVVGEDFRFGYKRAGDYHTLEQYEKTYGYQTIVVKKMQEDGRDISSTYIREEIAKGNIKKANHLLGYEYFVKSNVVHGKKLGRTIGVPTINMEFSKEKLLPPNGVYVTKVYVEEKTYLGVTNVGSKPTVCDNGQIGVETYIIDFCQDVYGKMIVVSFLEYIRAEKRFLSIEELKEQMLSDIGFAKNYYENIT